MQTRGRLDACNCKCLELPAAPVGNYNAVRTARACKRGTGGGASAELELCDSSLHNFMCGII